MHKKRRILQTNPKDSSAIRASFSAEFRSSENQFNASKADEPKTSEYAFFKKLKTDASHRFHSRPLHKDRPNKFKGKDLPIDRSSEIKNSSEELGFPTEDGTHVNRRLLLTPVGVDLKRASTTFQDIYSIGKSIEEDRTLRPKGTQNKHKDLFSRKRQKLHQSVSDISFPEMGELCSKGYDFVSVLLSRLFPESNEENSFKIPNYWQLESVSKNKLPGMSPVPKKLPYSSIHLNKLPHQSPRNFLEVECGSYLENGSSACWLDNSRDRTHSNPDSPTCHSHSTLLDYSLREPGHKLGERNKISWIDSEYSFSLPPKTYGHLHSNHLRELNDFHDPSDSLFRRKQHPLLLGWDPENVTDERASLISENTELINCPMSLSSWSSDYEESLNDEFSPFVASGLCASSVICKHTPNFYSLPPSYRTRYCEDEYRRLFLEDNEDRVTDLNHYPLTLSLLSHVPSYPNLTEYWNYDPTHKDSWTLPSPGNYHWFMKEVFSEQHCDPGMEVSKLDYDLGRKSLSICESSNKHYSFICPALPSPQKEHMLSHSLSKDEHENFMDGLNPRGIFDHYIQDMVSAHDWSPFCCPISLDKQKPCPLLLDKSS